MAKRRRKVPTEADWLACAEPPKMLDMVKDRVSVRKMRLVGVACCRHISHLFHAEACDVGVAVAERFADGLAGEEERLAAYCAVGKLEEDGNSLFGRACWKLCVRCGSRCMPDHLVRFKGSRPSTRMARMAKWFSACSQPTIGTVHFFDASLIAK